MVIAMALRYHAKKIRVLPRFRTAEPVIKLMITNSLIGVLLIALTVTIQATGTTMWVRFVGRRFVERGTSFMFGESLRILIATGLLLVILHAIQIVLWALTYQLVLEPGELVSMHEAIYFSFVTFTTLGYGDITLSGDHRVLSGIEALNGILLVGWSTAVLFAVVQRIWQNIGGPIARK